MTLHKAFLRLTLLGVACCVLADSGAFAATATSAATAPATASAPASGAKAQAPSTAAKSDAALDPGKNPALALIMNSGAKLYYLGNKAGMDGWFILKDGQAQIAYATPDGHQALIGALFSAEGENLTAGQVEDLFNANPSIKTQMTNAARLGFEADKAKMIASAPMMSAAQTLNSLPNATQPTWASTSGPSPGEQLYQDMVGAKGVMVGSKTAPVIFMVMDPNCPHCQATWRAVRDAVLKNTLQVRLIPIGTEDTDSERAAAQLLHVSEPLDAWNKYVDGDKTQLAGTPDPMLISAVQANHLMVDDWNLRQTPIIVYRSKDGKVKIEQGEPEKIAAMLSDVVAPPNP